MSLRCIIIDDEPNAVSLLEVLIKQTTNWQLEATCYNALEAIAFLKDHKVDFIFLDINMPLLSGIELAELLPKQVNIVFTTAYAEHAADSYNYQTIDYLLKPITLKRFLAAVQKIELHFNKSQNVGNPQETLNDTHFFVKSGKTFNKLLLTDILYFEGEKEYVRLVTATEQLLIYRRLKEIAQQLQLPFVRVHNSFIVNIRQLDKIQDNHLFIGHKQIPISDKFREHFMTLVRERTF